MFSKVSKENRSRNIDYGSGCILRKSVSAPEARSC